MNIGIIGLGLMGGSLGLALKKLPEKYTLIGYDHNPTHITDALRLKLVDSVTSDFNEIKRCDVLILTIPVDAIIATSQELKEIKSTCTVIDFGSSKEKISQGIPKEIRHNFVTAHPMTGTEKFGPSAAIEGLYTEKTMVICDIEKSADYQKGIAISIFKDIHAKIVFMNAKEHDSHAAFISHMPHAVSYALAKSVMKQKDPKAIIALAGGGFKSMSRIAKSSPNMWEDIFRQNKDNLLESINAFNIEMKYCQELIEEDKWDELHAWISEANKLHDIL
ncbi:MAG: Prephenate and/or arogenate dehydrogenase (unknown specificity) (EC (EC [uncultured Sulfurovum sp.]|uniref:Prephenate/arogenate dehydrogenase domain-containing protein n=1 Tax=uncultured Sulfurovum sp. TaxID=269237 RepID=A0A6S6TC75_9BACT|nr:MAG: Prephenate and/or arogenate dehydrogenase (unknown specificity) (EC (EC [uncultured Sulfurovum sp.]